MARRSLEIVELLMEESRGPNEAEYKALLDQLKVHYDREKSDGPSVGGFVWPANVRFRNENVQDRIDTMARHIGIMARTIKQLQTVLEAVAEANEKVKRDQAARATRLEALERSAAELLAMAGSDASEVEPEVEPEGEPERRRERETRLARDRSRSREREA